MKNVFAVLDIGNATTKLLVGEVVSANINVLYTRKVISRGIRKNKIHDMNAVSEMIKELVDHASSTLGAPIEQVALSIPSYYTKLYRGEGITKVTSPTGVITNEDVIRGLKLSSKLAKDFDEEIVSIIPTKYYLDTRAAMKSPVGMTSASLKIDSLIITTKKENLYSYIMAVENAGLKLLDITIDAYACAKEAFDEVYLNEGAILIDIGYLSSTVSFFEDGYLKYIAKAKTGGYFLTKAIANAWNIPMDKAELYKVRYGTCEDHIGNEDIIHTSKSEDGSMQYTQKDLALVLNEAVNEMFEIIKQKIDVINDGRNYETIIVGGGGELPNIEEKASQVLDSIVRTYRPDTIGAREMAYVSSLGMVYYLNDRSSFMGKISSSVELPDISNTMAVRLKGLTKSKDEEKSKGKFSSLLDKIFNDDDGE